MNKNIAVFFGGVSCEHDISVVTGVQVLNSLSSRYTIFPIYISSEGEWYTGSELFELKTYEEFDRYKKKLKKVCMHAGSDYIYRLNGKKIIPLARIYCAVLAMHGLNGEDGSLAGFLQLCGVPVTSSGLLGSSVGMDKIAMKLFFKGLGLETLPYVTLRRSDYAEQPQKVIGRIEKQLGYPVIIKPAMLGSSIGINKCRTRAELIDAIDIGLGFDRRLIAERCEENFTEINCSAVKLGKVIKVSQCEQPISWTDFLTFEDKYMQDSVKGMAASKRIFPARAEKQTIDTIKNTTALIYSALELKGVVRADFIVSDKVYINEINTIPGSLSFYMWEREGYSFSQLLDAMIDHAAEDLADFKRCNFSFKTNVIGGIKGACKS